MNNTPPSTIRSIANFIGRWTWRVFGTLIICGAIFILLAQTDFFRRWIRDRVIAYANDALIGKLAIDDARLDIFRGIVLKHPRLYAEGTTVFEADEVSLSYDVASLFNRVIAIGELRLVHPTINLIRSDKGVWNFERIVKPPADTATTELPDLTISAHAVIIEDGILHINDRTTPGGDRSKFDPTHLDAKDLKAHLTIRAALRKHDFALAINGLSFTNLSGPVSIKNIIGAVRASRQGIDVQSLRVTTNKSDVWARARLDGIDVASGLNDSLLRAHPIVSRVEVDNLHGADLKYFIPAVDLLDDYSLTADVLFDGNNLGITDMHLTAGDADVKGIVYIKEMGGKKPMFLDITVHDSHARYSDIRRRLHFVELPELTFLETTQLNSVHLFGHPANSISFNVDANDKPGACKGTMTLFLSKPTLGYDVDMNIRGGDLSVFSNDPDYSTDINGRVMMVGSGVTLQELYGTTQIELDRSHLFGRPVRSFRTMIQSDGKGSISVDTMFADLTPFSDDTTKPDPFSDVSSQRISAHANLNIADKDHPHYSGNVSIDGLDVASLFDSPSMPSRFSWRSDFDLEGIELDSVKGTIKGRVYELALADRSMMPFSLEARSVRNGTTREISIESDFAKGRVYGSFNPSTMFEAIGTSIDAVAQVIALRTKHLLNDTVTIDTKRKILEPIDAMVDLEILDASPINIAVPDVMISGAANLKGRFLVGSNDINIQFDSITMKQLAIKTDDIDVYVEPTTSSVNISIDDMATHPTVRKIEIVAACDSLVRINDQRIVRPRVNFSDHSGNVAFTASAGVNDMRFGVAASGHVDVGSIDLSIDSASFTLDPRRELRWRLTRPAKLKVKEGVYEIDELIAQRAWGESVKLSGMVSDGSFTNFHINVTNFPLRDIPLFVLLEQDHPVRLMDGLVTSLDVSVNGEWKKPVIDVSMEAVDVSYNGALIGTMHAKFRHEEQSIAGKLDVVDPRKDTTKKTLTLNVNALPIDMAFADVAERVISNRPIDIELEANDLALAAIEPFIPAIERLQGTANATITVKGTTPENITLGGNGRFKNARFIASSTNIEYVADGVLRLEDQTLFLDTVTVRNTQRDLIGGIARSRGQIFFNGLSVDSIDFIVTTPTDVGIKVMNRSSQARSPNIYGDFVMSSGDDPIHFFGRLDSPKLTGDIIVNYANITFPKERSSTKARQTAFTYLRSDSVTVRKKSIADFGLRPVTHIVDTVSNDSTTTAIEEVIHSLIKASTPSFSDLIYYKLDIYLRGQTLLTMILGTFEMLVADLQQVDRAVPLSFTGRFADNSTNLRGVVRLKEGNSTYKFYKPFRTSGTLNFNSGGMTNPALDLKAVYEDSRTISSGGSTKREDYKVELTITGTKQFPRVAYRVWRNNREVVGDSNKIAGDALMLILVGRTQDELFAEGQGNLVNEVNSAFSAVATNALSDILGENAVANNVQLDVGSDISQSRLTVSGQLLGDVSYRVSGQISDFTGNSTFTLTIPFSVLGDAEALRYLQTDFSHTVNNTGNITRQTRLWEIKLGARLP